MDPAILALFIPLSGIGLGFFAVWSHHRQKIAKFEAEARQQSTGSDQMTSNQAAQIRELQERIKVMERIVTDGGYDLATKIEALRDERALPAAVEARVEPERLS